ALFGILHAGAVVVPINNFLKPDEVKFILADAGIDVLITDAELGVHFPALQAARPGLKLLQIETLLTHQGSGIQNPESRIQRPSPLPLPSTHPLTPASSSLAVIIYTSGTTGRPKGAMLSHANLLHNVESCRIVLRTVEADRFAV